MRKHKIIGLFIGTPKELGPNKILTSINKNAVTTSIDVRIDTIEGDEVANLKYHGGPDRVIHHYSLEQYDYLKSIFPEYENLFVPGSYGENLTTSALSEKDLCIGDIFSIGEVKLQLSEGRKPCGTIELKYGVRGILKEIKKSGRYGWFYRVLKGGRVFLNDELELVERPYPNLNLKKLINEIFNEKHKNLDLLKEAYHCEAISQRWKDIIYKFI